jgi:hypothetical protein
MLYLVSDKYKYIIVTFPKSGCTTVRLLHLYLHSDQAEQQRTDFEDEHHFFSRGKQALTNAEQLLAVIHENPGYYVVVVYRDPFKRLVSCFYQRNCGVGASDMRLKGKLVDGVNKLEAYNTFEKFLVAAADGTFRDLHAVPQVLGKEVTAKVDKFLNIRRITELFKDYNTKLWSCMVDVMKKYNLNNRNSLKKRTRPNMPNLSQYNFYEDRLGLLVEPHCVPDYSYILTNDVKRKIRSLYLDEFYEKA